MKLKFLKDWKDSNCTSRTTHSTLDCDMWYCDIYTYDGWFNYNRWKGEHKIENIYVHSTCMTWHTYDIKYLGIGTLQHNT